MALEPAPAGGASSSSPPAIRVVETVFVQPSPSPSDPAAPPESSFPLTFFDIFWVNSPPVERVFFYRLAPDADVDAVLSNLKSSLSTAVRAFFPLAGRLRLAAGSAHRYELHYRPGDGVTFTVAEYDGGKDLDELATDDAREVAAIAPCIPPLPAGGAVLALQATVLSGRRGLALGVAVHHAACDGAGSTHFLRTWAAAAAQRAPAPPPPVIDRSLVADPRGLYDAFYAAVPTRDESEFVKMAPDQLLATFVLSRDDLQRVKDAVAAEAARRRGAGTPPRCSSFVAALGLVWSCYHRAKEETSSNTTDINGDGDGGRACLLFAVDHRSRTNPPLPDTYLGNCVGPAFALAPRDDGVAGGLFAACAAVAASIQEAVGEFGTPAMDAWMERVREVSAMGPLSVAGSPRFRVYEMDFGFGAPAKVDIVSVARTGAVAVAESRSGEGGGMEVGVSLRPRGMDAFRNCFAEAIAWLHAGAE